MRRDSIVKAANDSVKFRRKSPGGSVGQSLAGSSDFRDYSFYGTVDSLALSGLGAVSFYSSVSAVKVLGSLVFFGSGFVYTAPYFYFSGYSVVLSSYGTCGGWQWLVVPYNVLVVTDT